MESLRPLERVEGAIRNGQTRMISGLGIGGIIDRSRDTVQSKRQQSIRDRHPRRREHHGAERPIDPHARSRDVNRVRPVGDCHARRCARRRQRDRVYRRRVVIGEGDPARARMESRAGCGVVRHEARRSQPKLPRGCGDQNAGTGHANRVRSVGNGDARGGCRNRVLRAGLIVREYDPRRSDLNGRACRRILKDQRAGNQGRTGSDVQIVRYIRVQRGGHVER